VSARAARFAAAFLAFVSTFLIYRSTLLPGFDFGDTPSFQVMAGEPMITPRDAYPLYFGIGRLFVWGLGGDPARALNTASAVEAALASSIVVLVASELAGSAAAGFAVGLLLAGSYTFWSQAIIAEVYALHAVFVALTLLLLLRWSARPTLGRLTWFVAVYALGFGNHLTMILLAPAYLLFLFLRAPGGWRSLINARVVLMTLTLTALASLQYAWNLRALWLAPMAPDSLLDGLGAFWFDVTKEDWRQSMVAEVPIQVTGERLRMYAFDMLQQFGWIGPALAAAGLVQLYRTDGTKLCLLGMLYAVNAVFALSYNVGDAHVFFLPSHLAMALLAAPGLVWLGSVLRRPRAVPLLAAALAFAAGVRIYDNFPALDRSGDTRPEAALSALSRDLDDQRAVLLTDMNWQAQNGLTYFARRMRQDLAFALMPDVLPYAPALIRDNLAIGRDVVLTERAAMSLTAAYGSSWTLDADPRVATPTLAELARSIPAGTRYVVCVLRPTRETSLDTEDVAEGLRILTGGSPVSIDGREFMAVGGLAGTPPLLAEKRDAPFRTRFDLGGVPVDVRMESWLAFDTIRRMGFGHVVAARRHALIVERGVSLVTLDGRGAPIVRAYLSGIFAPEGRYIVRR